MRYLFIFFLACGITFSQEVTQKQQLITQLDTTTIVKNKVQLYADIAWEYIIEESDSALFFADKALSFSKQNSYPLGEAIALETKGIYQEVAKGNYDLASQYYFKAIDICKANNLDYEASVYHSLGVMFHTSDNYEKALEYYTKSFDLAKKANNKVLTKKCLINLGAVHSSLEHFEEASKFMKASIALPIRPELDYTTFANLGYLYVKQKNYNEALKFLEKSIAQHPENRDSELNLYLYIHAKVEAKDTTNMSRIIKRAETAIDHYGPRDKSLLIRNIADYYTLIKDYKRALNYRNAYITVFETIKDKQKDDIVLELEAKYQTQQKDTALQLLEAENQNKEQQKQFYFIAALLGLVIATLLGYFAYTNRKQKLILAKQKNQLEIAVKQKNILFKEIHHRVKNSLQMVSSLLFLQSQNIANKDAKSAIKVAQNRVRSLSLIHQKLYSKKHLTGIETKDYFTDLTQDIFNSHQLESQDIKHHLDIENMVLSVDTLTPIGLILNELIINVLKHAFKNSNTTNNLWISFHKTNDTLVLKVTDNGLGYDSTKAKESSFGLKLIKSLAKKLEATFTINANAPHGTTTQLLIKDFEIITTA